MPTYAPTSHFLQKKGYTPTQFQPSIQPTPAPHPPQPKPAIQPSPSPSPPPPELPRHWDTALKHFLTRLGLTQTLRGFELDMLVMNPDHERSVVPGAIKDLLQNLSVN